METFAKQQHHEQPSHRHQQLQHNETSDTALVSGVKKSIVTNFVGASDHRHAVLLPSSAPVFYNHHYHHPVAVGRRIYRSATSSAAGDTTTPAAAAPRLVTREIAALDFLLGIPLENETSIVRAGLNARLRDEEQERETNKPDHAQHRQQHHEKHSAFGASSSEETSSNNNSLHWWEKINSNNTTADKARIMRERMELEEKELEQPSGEDNNNETFATEITSTALEGESLNRIVDSSAANNQIIKLAAVETYLVAQLVAPGRRLDGREASLLHPPKVVCTMDKLHHGRSIAATSALREWEIRLAHGIGTDKKDAKGLLDGRAFFSSQQGYPLAVFSLIRYEPKKEEAARRRRKVEEMGGGGTLFVIPERDWRGVSYAALMKKHHKRNQHQKNSDQSSNSLSDDETCSLSSSDESDMYEPGYIDDPAMVQGRHRHVMVGNKVTGPIISSVIQFVDPADLKADLNKQFRARFDGWEPPKCQRRYIGGHVVNGVYTLTDPTDSNTDDHEQVVRKVTSFNSDIDTIRMPPSLTLSKIRSLKRQVLLIGLKSDLEISTIALAFVYFERLCLDCRVDKSNRQLTFASCLLLAYKTNEPNVAVIHTKPKETKKGMQQILHTFIQPERKSIGVFSSLLDCLTNQFSLSLKHLFAAEWGVFVALGFKLHAKPSQVAFHFKRFMKVLEKNALHYLGEEMYQTWQACLVEESQRKDRHEERRRFRRENTERKLMKLQRQLQQRQQEAATRRRSLTVTGLSSSTGSGPSSGRGSHYGKIMEDEQEGTGTSSRRISMLGGYESIPEDSSPSFLPVAPSSAPSEEPSPKRATNDKVGSKMNLKKMWAGNSLRMRQSPPVVDKAEIDGFAAALISSPTQILRKVVSSPHLNPDSCLSPESGLTIPYRKLSFVSQRRASLRDASESIPIDILLEGDEDETQEEIFDGAEMY